MIKQNNQTAFNYFKKAADKVSVWYLHGMTVFIFLKVHKALSDPYLVVLFVGVTQ